MGDTYADFTGGNDFYEIGQLITKTIGDMNITGNVAYIYGDSTGGTGVVKFQEGMLDSMKNCDVEVVGEQWTTNWDPATAMGYAENWIAEYGDSLTAILCMNDGMAGGADPGAGRRRACGQGPRLRPGLRPAGLPADRPGHPGLHGCESRQRVSAALHRSLHPVLPRRKDRG